MSELAVPVQRLPARDLTWAPPLALGLGVALVAAADGGYFPTSWGWLALGLAWASALAVTVGRPPAPSRLQLSFLGLLLALVGWIWLSAVWADDPAAAIREGLRTLTLPLGALAAALVVRRPAAPTLLAGLWGGIVAVCGYGLVTRLAPDRLGVLDPIAGYRLSEPLGYWNALGAFAALGILLAIGLAAERRGRVLPAAAAASVQPLAACLYFTFSRGGWVALALGLAAAFAVAPRRGALAAAALAAGLPAAGGVWIASRSEALTTQRAGLPEAAADGHALVVVLAALAATGAAATLLACRPRMERAAALALGAAVVALLAGLIVQFGSPHAWPGRAWDAFNAAPPVTGGDLNRRLLNLSGSGRVTQWEVALDQAREHLAVGSGAGSYEAYWLEHRIAAGKVRDAHSVYLETLGELGIAGLCLLVFTLLLPLYALSKARRHALVPAAFGAYVAYLVHAGVDWDWEMPAVTVTAILIGSAILAAARRGEERRMSPRVRYALLGGALALAAAALVGLAGNIALAQSAQAARAGDWNGAITAARNGARWAPWSPEPWKRLGEAQLAQGDPAAARASFRRAAEKAPRDWEAWLDVARASDGRAHDVALARAAALNPLSPEIARFRAEVGGEPVLQVTG